ncbi:allophanate hydrolase [Actinomadura rayongensis]|uniref:Allophanate hydrolase n=1 Tax=Actinomadura rayongensis TaxID=1429076 RepID=A0A6I4WE14_9ACTN|nr:allophanate hydrolase [Actinomadura rayongensis]MXQ67293.1 allophanate hydrolase [Actinomadura rayongensis]
MNIPDLTARYRAGTDPATIVHATYDRIDARGDDHVWITLRSRADVLADAAALTRRWPDPATRPPLWGVPFGVKDSLDVAGIPTTVACPAYAYVPDRTAPLVRRLLDGGALLVGKTNLDQFATGLSGMRSPYGTPESPLVPGLVCGGSSSGSAVAVGAGLVPFAVATDTAGSGRVPAVLTGTVGFKPTRGLVSTLGLVPACESIDCASVIARTVADACAVLSVMAGPEPGDPWSRDFPGPGAVPADTGPLRVGVPDHPEFHGDAAAAAGFGDAVARLDALGHTAVPVDLRPFLAAGRLLYDGPWVAERLAVFGDFLADHGDDLHPVTRRVLSTGGSLTAVDAFRGLHRLQTLKAATRPVWDAVDVLAVPTVPTTFTRAEMAADPIGRNTVLGHYTMFANLLDLAAVAVPAGTTATGRPHGVTFLGPAGSDAVIAGAAAGFTGETARHNAVAVTPHAG